MLKRAEALVGKPLREFDGTSSEALTRAMQEKGFSQNTKALMIASLRGAFDWAIGTKQYTQEHPFEGILVSRPPRALPRVFTDSELENVFNSIENEKYKLFFKLMYYCGLRINEVRTLRKDALHTLNEQFFLLIKGKGSVERMVPIPEFLSKELIQFMNVHYRGDYVFYNESYHRSWDKPMSTSYAYELFRELKTLLNLPDNARPHNFRSTSATKMHRATGDLAQTQRFLGHARPETTMIYVQVSDDQLQQASKAAFAQI